MISEQLTGFGNWRQLCEGTSHEVCNGPKFIYLFILFFTLQSADVKGRELETTETFIQRKKLKSCSVAQRWTTTLLLLIYSLFTLLIPECLFQKKKRLENVLPDGWRFGVCFFLKSGDEMRVRSGKENMKGVDWHQGDWQQKEEAAEEGENKRACQWENSGSYRFLQRRTFFQHCLFGA